jgi:hypothetical protein
MATLRPFLPLCASYPTKSFFLAYSQWSLLCSPLLSSLAPFLHKHSSRLTRRMFRSLFPKWYDSQLFPYCSTNAVECQPTLITWIGGSGTRLVVLWMFAYWLLINRSLSLGSFIEVFFPHILLTCKMCPSKFRGKYFLQHVVHRICTKYPPSVLPGGQPTAAPIQDLGQQTGTSFTWPTNIAAGELFNSYQLLWCTGSYFFG